MCHKGVLGHYQNRAVLKSCTSAESLSFFLFLFSADLGNVQAPGKRFRFRLFSSAADKNPLLLRHKALLLPIGSTIDFKRTLGVRYGGLKIRISPMKFCPRVSAGKKEGDIHVFRLKKVFDQPKSYAPTVLVVLTDPAHLLTI